MKKLPEAEFSGENLHEMQVLPIESYGIYEWTPELDGKGKPEQVHFVLELKDMSFKFVLRLKSKNACDTLIESLTRHRLSVWPEGEQ